MKRLSTVVGAGIIAATMSVGLSASTAGPVEPQTRSTAQTGDRRTELGRLRQELFRLQRELREHEQALREARQAGDRVRAAREAEIVRELKAQIERIQRRLRQLGGGR